MIFTPFDTLSRACFPMMINQTGTSGNDSMQGSSGSDSLDGAGGDDSIFGLLGDDTLRGGLGLDYIEGGDGADHIFGEDGNDIIYGDNVDPNNLTGLSHDDTIFGGDGADTIYGGEGNDTIYGDLATDIFSQNKNTLFGGAGDDTLIGGRGQESLIGGAGNDLLVGNKGNDVLDGGEGNDRLVGSQDWDTLNGGNGNDILEGGDGLDVLNGGDGDDVFKVAAGDDSSHSLFNYYNGGAGLDTILGSTGNDFIRLRELGGATGNSGIETIDGGAGYDILSVNGHRDLDARTSTGVTLLNIEELHGGNTNNTIHGTDEGIIIKGQRGDDTIFGGLGEDTLFGNEGNDRLDGGDGHDVATFSGNRDDYTITEQPDGSLVVTHNGGGVDGIDTLTNIETLRFADGEVMPFALSALDARTMVEVNSSVTWKLSVSGGAGGSSQVNYDIAQNGGPNNGTVTFDSQGNYTYTPNAGFTGSDSFTYIATETTSSGGTSSTTATISVDIVANNEEFQVNRQETDGDQSDPLVAHLENGKFVVVWHSNGNDTADNSDYGVYAQIYQANGQPQGDAFLVNTDFINSTQSHPDVASFADGSFVVSWQSYGSGGGGASRYAIHTQKYSSDGTPQGDPAEVFGHVNTQNRYPSITTLNKVNPSDPDYVVTWAAEKVSNGDERIYASPVTISVDSQTGDVTHNPGTIVQVNTVNDHDQRHPSVTALKDGGYVIVWHSWLQDGDSWGIYGQRYDSGGAKSGGEFHVSDGVTANQQKAPSVASLDDGGFMVTYASAHNSGNDYDIFIQRYNSSGAQVGDEIRVNQYTTDRQHGPDLVELTDGTVLITWESQGQDGSDRGIYARRYDKATGQFQDDEFQVHQTTAGQQEIPTIAALPEDGFVITWRSDSDSDGDYEVHARVYDAPGQQLDGTAGNDVLMGGQGADTLLGKEGEDKLSGGDGADTFSFSLSADSGADSVTDFSTSDGDILAFEDVVDADNDQDIDINDAVTAFSKNGNEITLSIQTGGSIVVTELDNTITDLNDLTTHMTINGA